MDGWKGEGPQQQADWVDHQYDRKPELPRNEHIY
eukprot:CAMPEP_0119003518 /NCGR_PEP_ID=MMETSP1176-20130426/606_1 /TAXON_ID=265551 /ORGANISM="Synedropsis recta cf, Strain CCMP1620" /LENGTH=33 /DNA_ID= /DNA_START= /DNA_END= /DNA_ORIENTATION=